MSLYLGKTPLGVVYMTDKTMTGGDAVVAGLKRWDVETVFGLPGIQLDGLFDGLQRDGSLRIVHSRHEQGAAYMAFGYAQVTGRPGVCAVVPGPGLLNAGAALATAFACNARVLCITSTIPSQFIGLRQGLLHDIEDQSGLLRGLTKWYARANDISEIPRLLDEAFIQLMSGRPRPVALEIPPDILAQTGLPSYPESRPVPLNPAIPPTSIERAVTLIALAKKPVIIVGGGAQDAGPEVRQLAARIGAPVVSRAMGRGVVRSDDPLSLPGAALLPHWPNVDLVIGIGTRLQHLREWGHDQHLKVIRIDLDHAEMYRVIAPDVAITADAKESALLLNSALAATDFTPNSPGLDIAAIRSEFEEQFANEFKHQIDYLDAIREAMADNDIFVDEMTQMGYAARFALPILSPRSFVTSSYQGTLGYGYATALGAQVGAGSRRVISVNGDGGFLFTMPELATAVQHKIPLISIVFNDGHFGNVRRIQKAMYGGRVIATDLHNPDFPMLATAFGATGMRAENPEELRTALAAARQIDGPVLIEVPVDGDAIPSAGKYLYGRKVR
jgi:acetolactate synthase-1/2/3 large subunit